MGTILDDEPRVSINDASGNEGDAHVNFTLTLSTPATSNVVVTYATADKTTGSIATGGVDYTPTSGTVTFTPGSVGQTISVAILGDSVDEDDEQFTVNLTSITTNASIGDGEATGTIVDNDNPPTVSVQNVTVNEGDSGTQNAVFTVMLDVASGRPVTLTFDTVDGTASQTSDYVATSGVLSFAPGETSKQITVQVNGDVVAEPNETFSLRITQATNATLPTTPLVATGTISDNEPQISILDVSIAEGDSGTQNAIFTVLLNGPALSTVSANYVTSNITATAGTDYSPAAGSVVFAPGESQQAITVQILGDVVREPDETFRVTLSSPSGNARIVDGEGIGTIGNDDLPPVVAVSNSSANEGDAGTTNMVFNVTLTPGQRPAGHRAIQHGEQQPGQRHGASGLPDHQRHVDLRPWRNGEDRHRANCRRQRRGIRRDVPVEPLQSFGRHHRNGPRHGHYPGQRRQHQHQSHGCP